MEDILKKDHAYFRAIYDHVYPMREGSFGGESSERCRDSLMRMMKEFCDEVHRRAREDLLVENAAVWKRLEQYERKFGPLE